MDKVTILFFVSTLVLVIGHPTNRPTDSNPDDFFGANSLDADPISSEQAEQYKQELLRQQKLQQELLLEAQRVTTQILQNTEKAIINKEDDEDIKIASTTTVQPEEVHTVTTEKEKISTTATTTTSTPPPTTHSATVTTTSAPSTTASVPQGPTRPQRNPQAVGMLSRIIDDIFQIPISVIQSVTRLLRNPFAPRRTPESASTY